MDLTTTRCSYLSTHTRAQLHVRSQEQINGSNQSTPLLCQLKPGNVVFIKNNFKKDTTTYAIFKLKNS